MAQHLHVADHLSAEQLGARYRAASDPVERTHFQVLHLAKRGWRSAEIAEASGYSVVWVRKLVARYNEGGPEALGDGRRHNPGQARLLTPEQEAELERVLRTEKPAGGGLWTGPKVAAWMSNKLGRAVAAQRGWEVLVRLGFRLLRPRRRHAGADAEAQERFQGGVATSLAR
jgi:transposase